MSEYKIPTEAEISSEISKAESKVSSSDNMTSTATTTAVDTSSSTAAQVDEYCYSDIMDKINECDDVVSALECVGAMYRIPAENILCDSNAQSIKVMNDCIIAPPSNNVSGNAKAIICAIGAVLDNISQRIDSKLNQYQLNNIDTGKSQAVRREANPAKGTVVGRYTDDNGDEIIVYDTGMVDMASTKEAIRKVDELRQAMKIPMYNPNALRKPGPQYFTASDDLSNGVNMSAGELEKPEDLSECKVDIASDIQESAFFMDLMSRYDNTTNLGYELFADMGFDFVKPVTKPITIQESDTSSSKKNISAGDIKYAKFDNTHILKAIEYFNKARAEQSMNERGKINKEALVQNPNFVKGVDELSKQFDARINIRISPDRESNAITIPNFFNEFKTKLHVSKSKGFQLNGLPIDIFWIGTGVDDLTASDDALFGQSFVSVCLHEIFHNIYYVLRQGTSQQLGLLQSTLMVASGIRDGKKKRIFLTNYVNTLSCIGGKKLNRLEKRVLVKQLAVISSVDMNDGNLNTIAKKLSEDSSPSSSNDEQTIDALIRMYENANKRVKKHYSYKKSIIKGIIAAVIAITGIIFPQIQAVGAIGGLLGLSSIISALSVSSLRSCIISYKSAKEMEEYYCDLFSGMYNLPQRFFLDLGISQSAPNVTANQGTTEQLQKLATLERELSIGLFSSYPSMMERNHAGVKIAKDVLESDKNLDPAIKKYCQWIVDNYSKTLDTDIEEIYNTTTFDPKLAADLDEHLNRLITTNNIALTESYIDWMFDRNDMMIQESYHDYVDSEYFQEDGAEKKDNIIKRMWTAIKKFFVNMIKRIKNGLYNVQQKRRAKRYDKGKTAYYMCKASYSDLTDVANILRNLASNIGTICNQTTDAYETLKSNSEKGYIALAKINEKSTQLVPKIADDIKRADALTHPNKQQDQGKSEHYYYLTESELDKICVKFEDVLKLLTKVSNDLDRCINTINNIDLDGNDQTVSKTKKLNIQMVDLVKKLLIIVQIASSLIKDHMESLNQIKTLGPEKRIESIHVNNLGIDDVKKWFADKLTKDSIKGFIMSPTPENILRWKLNIDRKANEKILIQAIYDEEQDSVIKCRKIVYDQMGEKLKRLIDNNGGCFVIEK